MTNPKEKSKPREWVATYLVGSDDEKCIMSMNSHFIHKMFYKEKIHVIEYSAYQSALEQIAKLEVALENLSISLAVIGGMTIDEVVTGYINKNGGPIDEIDQALAELKKWRGEG